MSVVYFLSVLLLFFMTLPLQFAIACVAFVTSGSPVIFRQRRAGKDGKPFVLFKFRTMAVGAEAKQRRLLGQNESRGPTFKMRNDPRFTSFGKVLSHTGLDELPQFVNVLRGDMALIGPRPLPLSEARKLKPWMRERERITPGIISPAILTGIYHKDFDAWMKSDVAYVHNKSVSGDASLLLRFVPFVVKLLVQGLSGY